MWHQYWWNKFNSSVVALSYWSPGHPLSATPKTFLQVLKQLSQVLGPSALAYEVLSQ